MKELRCRWASLRFGMNPLGSFHFSAWVGPQPPSDLIPVARPHPLDLPGYTAGTEIVMWRGREFVRKIPA